MCVCVFVHIDMDNLPTQHLRDVNLYSIHTDHNVHFIIMLTPEADSRLPFHARTLALIKVTQFCEMKMAGSMSFYFERSFCW